jgi:mRNA interferase MazF
LIGRKPPVDPDRRGEVWLVDLGYAAKVRPCLVLSVQLNDADRALVTLVPHTTSPRGSRFEIASAERFLKVGVFDAQNLVTVPQAKLIRRLGALGADDLSTVEDAVRRWLGLSN